MFFLQFKSGKSNSFYIRGPSVQIRLAAHLIPAISQYKEVQYQQHVSVLLYDIVILYEEMLLCLMEEMLQHDSLGLNLKK